MSATRILVHDAPAPAAQTAGAANIDQRPRPDHRDTEGSLVCVAGTSGGAGATTVALLLTWQAAHDGGRVLCCDAAGPAGDLARHAGASSKRSLVESAALLARGRLEPDGLFAMVAGGVRLIAANGGLQTGATGVGRLLSLARQAHDLIAVDAGTLASQAAIATHEQASHIVWVLPATPTGAQRAQATLEAIGRHASARELVLARGDEKALGRVRPRQLQRLAAERHSPLIALPHIEQLALPARRDTALKECATGLRALSTLTGARVQAGR